VRLKLSVKKRTCRDFGLWLEKAYEEKRHCSRCFINVKSKGGASQLISLTSRCLLTGSLVDVRQSANYVSSGRLFDLEFKLLSLIKT